MEAAATDRLYRTFGDARLEEIFGVEHTWALDPEERSWPYPRQTRELDLLPFLKGHPTRRYVTLSASLEHGHFYERHTGRHLELAGVLLRLVPGPPNSLARLVNAAIPLAEVPHPWIGQGVLLGVPDHYTEAIARAAGALLPVLFTHALLGVEVQIIHGFYHPSCSPEHAFHKAAGDTLRHLATQIARERLLWAFR